MKKLTLLLTLLIALLPSTVLADAEQQGWNAYLDNQYQTAIQLWQPEAEQGNVELQHMVGFMYMQGQGVARDFDQAMMWFDKAAAQDYDAAMFAIGSMYENGHGVAQSNHKALDWYQRAAQAGFVHGQTCRQRLHRCNLSGGVGDSFLCLRM